jgi:hypothetical protein
MSDCSHALMFRCCWSCTPRTLSSQSYIHQSIHFYSRPFLLSFFLLSIYNTILLSIIALESFILPLNRIHLSLKFVCKYFTEGRSFLVITTVFTFSFYLFHLLFISFFLFPFFFFLFSLLFQVLIIVITISTFRKKISCLTTTSMITTIDTTTTMTIIIAIAITITITNLVQVGQIVTLLSLSEYNCIVFS